MRAETFVGRLVAALARIDSEPQVPSDERLSQQGHADRLIGALMRTEPNPVAGVEPRADSPSVREAPADFYPVEPRAGTKDRSKLTVLVVDDHEPLARAIARDLRRHGFRVVGIAQDGQRGVAMAKDESPDVITMDVRMPGMTGIEATAAIIADNPKAKIVVVTAYAEPKTLYESLAAGARGFLAKPFSDDELASTLEGVYSGELLVEAGLSASLQNVTFGPLSFKADEKSVLQFLAQGLNVQEISAAMKMPVENVVKLQDRIIENINLRNLLATH